MSVVIRPRIEEDIPALADVLVRVHAKDGYPVEGVADPEAWLRSDRMLGAWVAEVDGEVVGHVMLTEPGGGDKAAQMLVRRDGLCAEDVAVLGRLFVDPTARGQRISYLLLDEAVLVAGVLKRRPTLDVMQKDAAAIAAYRRRGWVPLGNFNHLYPGGEEPAIAFSFPAKSIDDV